MTLMIKDVSGRFCSDCGEVAMDRTEAGAYMERLKEAQASNDPGG